MSSVETQLQIETLKLLVSVAWADREVAPAELDYIVRLAAESGALPTEVASLREDLADVGRLTAPNLELLKGHKADVLRAVDGLIAADDKIVTDEVAARTAIDKLLGD